MVCTTCPNTFIPLSLPNCLSVVYLRLVCFSAQRSSLSLKINTIYPLTDTYRVSPHRFLTFVVRRCCHHVSTLRSRAPETETQSREILSKRTEAKIKIEKRRAKSPRRGRPRDAALPYPLLIIPCELIPNCR